MLRILLIVLFSVMNTPLLWGQAGPQIDLCSANGQQAWEQVAQGVKISEVEEQVSGGEVVTVTGNGFSALPSSGMIASLVGMNAQCQTIQHSASIFPVNDSEFAFRLPGVLAINPDDELPEQSFKLISLTPTYQDTNLCPQSADLRNTIVWGWSDRCLPGKERPVAISGFDAYATSSESLVLLWRPYPEPQNIDGFRVYMASCSIGTLCTEPDPADWQNRAIFSDLTLTIGLLPQDKTSEPITELGGLSRVYVMMSAVGTDGVESLPTRMIMVDLENARSNGGNNELAFGEGQLSVTFPSECFHVFPDVPALLDVERPLRITGTAFYDDEADGIVERFVGETNLPFPVFADPSGNTGVTWAIGYASSDKLSLRSNVVAVSNFELDGVIYSVAAHMHFDTKTNLLTLINVFAGHGTERSYGFVLGAENQDFTTGNLRIQLPTTTSNGLIEAAVMADVGIIEPVSGDAPRLWCHGVRFGFDFPIQND